ncbi:MAG TPA: ABC transporter permease, partial [Acidimicrobiales bacterium]|nr:ABC transporter permease [Acidimicrobiales bacterium]
MSVRQDRVSAHDHRTRGSRARHGQSFGSPKMGELLSMLVASLRDMKWRRRRFVVTGIGTTLILTMTVVMAALSSSFSAEATAMVDRFGADFYVYSSHANGPFVGQLTMPSTAVAQVAALPGVRSARGGLFYQAPVLHVASKLVNVFGINPADAPPVLTGTRRLGPDDVLASSKLDHPTGSTILLGGHAFKVVGTVDSTILAGIPNIFLTLADAQTVYFHGASLVTFILVHGKPSRLPPGLAMATPQQTVQNLVAPMNEARGAFTFVAALLWIVAALIIGSVVYLSVHERTRDFAVFKATGVSNHALFVGVGLQAVIVALVSAAAGLGI